MKLEFFSNDETVKPNKEGDALEYYAWCVERALGKWRMADSGLAKRDVLLQLQTDLQSNEDCAAAIKHCAAFLDLLACCNTTAEPSDNALLDLLLGLPIDGEYLQIRLDLEGEMFRQQTPNMVSYLFQERRHSANSTNSVIEGRVHEFLEWFSSLQPEERTLAQQELQTGLSKVASQSISLFAK